MALFYFVFFKQYKMTFYAYKYEKAYRK